LNITFFAGEFARITIHFYFNRQQLVLFTIAQTQQQWTSHPRKKTTQKMQLELVVGKHTYVAHRTIESRLSIVHWRSTNFL